MSETTTKPRGRPRICRNEHSTPVHLKLPCSVFDRLQSVATLRRVTIQAVIRRAVMVTLETENRQTPNRLLP